MSSRGEDLACTCELESGAVGIPIAGQTIHAGQVLSDVPDKWVYPGPACCGFGVGLPSTSHTINCFESPAVGTLGRYGPNHHRRRRTNKWTYSSSSQVLQSVVDIGLPHNFLHSRRSLTIQCLFFIPVILKSSSALSLHLLHGVSSFPGSFHNSS